jgi:regulator of extracellular matrix RemA (YlzA/DUF370 family)
VDLRYWQGARTPIDAVHGTVTATATTGDADDRRPSLDGAVYDARHSYVLVGDCDEVYVPAVEPAAIVATVVQVVEPTARRWSATARPDNALPDNW